MDVSREQVTVVDPTGPGVRARSMRLMLKTAIDLMQNGQTPSVSDVAEAAGVSRATAYRYFPSQASLVDAVVDAALGPILEWEPCSNDAEERVRSLLDASLRRIGEFEATFRAALKLSLGQWAMSRAGTLGAEVPFKRGHRVALLQDAVAPLRGAASEEEFDRLTKGLSIVFGIEAFVVLKDIWGMEQEDAADTINWVARTLVSSVATGGAGADRQSRS